MQSKDLIQVADNVTSAVKNKMKHSTKKFPGRVRMSMKDRIAAEKSLFTRQYLEHQTKRA